MCSKCEFNSRMRQMEVCDCGDSRHPTYIVNNDSYNSFQKYQDCVSGNWPDMPNEYVNQKSNIGFYWARESEDVKLPTKRDEDFAYDIYAYFEEAYKVIGAHSNKSIPTGLYSDMPEGYALVGSAPASVVQNGIISTLIYDNSKIKVNILNTNNFPVVLYKNDIDFKRFKQEVNKNAIGYNYDKSIINVFAVKLYDLKIKDGGVLKNDN